MKYPDGQEVKLGDRVKLGEDGGGVVVASWIAVNTVRSTPPRSGPI